MSIQRHVGHQERNVTIPGGNVMTSGPSRLPLIGFDTQSFNKPVSQLIFGYSNRRVVGSLGLSFRREWNRTAKTHAVSVSVAPGLCLRDLLVPYTQGVVLLSRVVVSKARRQSYS